MRYKKNASNPITSFPSFDEEISVLKGEKSKKTQLSLFKEGKSPSASSQDSKSDKNNFPEVSSKDVFVREDIPFKELER